jgi:hypothetical protein
MLTFVLVNNDENSDLGADDDDRDCTRPIKLEANDKGSRFLGGARVLGLGL